MLQLVRLQRALRLAKYSIILLPKYLLETCDVMYDVISNFLKMQRVKEFSYCEQQMNFDIQDENLTGKILKFLPGTYSVYDLSVT